MCTSPTALQSNAGVGADAKHARVSFLVLCRPRRAVPQWDDVRRCWSAIFHSLQARSTAFCAGSHQPIDGLIFRWSLRGGVLRQEHTCSRSKSAAKTRGRHRNQKTQYESQGKERVSEHRTRLELQAVAGSSLTRWRPSVPARPLRSAARQRGKEAMT